MHRIFFVQKCCRFYFKICNTAIMWSADEICHS